MGFAKTDEERIAQNSPLCSPNKPVVFKGVVMVEGQDNFGKDKTRMVLTFNDKLSLAIFNPGERVWDQQKAAQKLHSLCGALGLDFKDIPHCKGGWHELIGEVIELTSPRKDTDLFAKITLNERGYFTLGEGVCFSAEPDMAYTDNDKHFILDVDLREPTPFILDDDIPKTDFTLDDTSTKKKITTDPDKVVWGKGSGKSGIAEKPVSKVVVKPVIKAPLKTEPKEDIAKLGPLNEDPDPMRRASTRNKAKDLVDSGLFKFDSVDEVVPPIKEKKSKKDDKVDPTDTTGDWLDQLDEARDKKLADKKRPDWVEEIAAERVPTAEIGKKKRTTKKKGPEPVDPLPSSPREDYDEVDLDSIPGGQGIPY